MRTGWYGSVHVKSLDAHRTRPLLGARAQLVGMTTRLSNHIRGALKTFGMLPDAMRGLPFDRRVEALLADRDDLAAIVRPVLMPWRLPREQIAVFDKAVRVDEEELDVPTFDERSRYRDRHCAGLREYRRGPGPLCPIAVGRRPHGADIKTVPVRQSRPQRKDFAMWRHACPQVDV
jgi:hypothetical protein